MLENPMKAPYGSDLAKISFPTCRMGTAMLAQWGGRIAAGLGEGGRRKEGRARDQLLSGLGRQGEAPKPKESGSLIRASECPRGPAKHPGVPEGKPHSGQPREISGQTQGPPPGRLLQATQNFLQTFLFRQLPELLSAFCGFCLRTHCLKRAEK